MIEKCAGCQKKHEDYHWRTRTVDGKTVWVCSRWFKTAVSREKKMEGMSTEQILSGGLAGLPNQFKTESEDYTPQVRRSQHETVLEAFK